MLSVRLRNNGIFILVTEKLKMHTEHDTGRPVSVSKYRSRYVSFWANLYSFYKGGNAILHAVAFMRHIFHTTWLQMIIIIPTAGRHSFANQWARDELHTCSSVDRYWTRFGGSRDTSAGWSSAQDHTAG